LPAFPPVDVVIDAVATPLDELPVAVADDLALRADDERQLARRRPSCP
jgi:hypothetical protein